ncbi:hypothetical protein Q5I06_02345 [Helicobacter sp. faydin-H76]|nr:tetratricopeptide repeat protein [Helicobacter sp. faydin-H76]MDP2538627.1 hypothetical protein [Helicobacter sp. faydin-H76]
MIHPFFIIPLSAEPSAFEMQSGATKKELRSLQTSSKNLETIITELQNKVISLDQSQDGVKSLFEGQSLKIKNLLDASASQENSIKSLSSVQDTHSNTLKQQSDLLTLLKDRIDKNQKAIEGLNKKVDDITELIGHINSDLMAQLELIKKNLEIPTTPTSTSNTSKISNVKKQTTPKESKTSNTDTFKKDGSKQKTIFIEAEELYKKGKLKEAKERFEWLVEMNYRPANSLYLLGEIAYKQKNYQQAVVFYKKSALENDKANYMPILLWHTAWAFRYSKDLPNYEKFLDSLIYLYPNSEQGQKAKDIRKKTKDKNEHRNK